MTTAVVHLVRAANGPEPFERFVAAYEAHDAGLTHDLVLLLKGFDDRDAATPYLERVNAGSVFVPDDGLDLTAYRAAAAALPHDRVCFLNSYSEPLAPGWLAHLARASALPGVGVAGATGSWGSHRSFALHLLRLPNGYRGTLGDRASAGPAFQSAGTAPQLGFVRRKLKALGDLPREIVGYPGFPAPHVRTNAFCADRELLRELMAGGRLRTKVAAYRFEAGSDGLPGRLTKRDLRPVVVTRDGTVVEVAAWPTADVFWQGDQRNLLVADNQTRAYAEGDAATRAALARYAWGDRARPR